MRLGTHHAWPGCQHFNRIQGEEPFRRLDVARGEPQFGLGERHAVLEPGCVSPVCQLAADGGQFSARGPRVAGSGADVCPGHGRHRHHSGVGEAASVECTVEVMLGCTHPGLEVTNLGDGQLCPHHVAALGLAFAVGQSERLLAVAHRGGESAPGRVELGELA